MKPRYNLFAVAVITGVVVASCTGCGAPAQALTLSEECRLGAWLALHVAKEAPPLAVPSPDKPDQGDLCPACDGKGQVGDGTVMFKCNDCNGTGRKLASAFDTPASAEAFEVGEVKAEVEERYKRQQAAAAAKPLPPVVQTWATPPRDGRTYRRVCDGKGKCHWELAQP